MQKLYRCEFQPEDVGQRYLIYPKDSPRFCRFCLNTETPLKFKKDAHVIPEALGNHYMLSAEECDRCNEKGSTLEDDLTKHLSVARAMARIAGKGGAVKHRYGKRPSSMTSEPGNDIVLVEHTEGDDSMRMKRTAGGISFSVRVPTYRPMNVIRALARLALFVAPRSELASLEHIRHWIRGELEWNPACYYEGFVPGPGMRLVWIDLTRIDDLNGPGYRLALGYSSRILVLDLPRLDWTVPSVPLPSLRTPFPPYDVDWKRYTVKGLDPVRERWDMIGIGVPALIGVPLPSDEHIRVAAYYQWLASGSEHGYDLKHWLDGEQAESARQVQELLGPAPDHVIAKFQ